LDEYLVVGPWEQKSIRSSLAWQLLILTIKRTSNQSLCFWTAYWTLHSPDSNRLVMVQSTISDLCQLAEILARRSPFLEILQLPLFEPIVEKTEEMKVSLVQSLSRNWQCSTSTGRLQPTVCISTCSWATLTFRNRKSRSDF